MKQMILSLAVASALAGCSSFPEGYDKPIKTTDIKQQKADEWGSMPAVVFEQSKAGKVVNRYNELPAAVRDKTISLSYSSAAQAKVLDVTFAMGTQGVRVVSRLEDDTMNKPWRVPSFTGTIGELLEEIVARYNIAYEYRGNTVFLVESNRYSANMPQHKAFIEGVETAIKAMGATEVRGDVLAGLVYYNAKPDNADSISDYLDTISKNAAMVTLQVAVLTVTVNRDVDLGFNWAKFAVMKGSGGMRSDLSSIFNNNSSNSGSNGGLVQDGGTSNSGSSNGGNTGNRPSTNGNTSTNVGTAVGDAATTVAKAVTGSLLGFSGAEGASYKFANNSFSLTAALSALSTYGNARTDQNVLLATLSGQPVKINSGDEIPYVKSIGSSTAAGGATSGSSQVDTKKSGLELDVIPFFDAADGSVITEVKVKMSTLVGFRELSAGLNLGTLSQPQMKDLSFENVSRLHAGDTIVVGGITYEQLTENYTNLPGMEKLALGSKSEKVNRNTIYIVVRPTIVLYTPNAAELTAKLAAAEAAARAAGEKKPASVGGDIQ